MINISEISEKYIEIFDMTEKYKKIKMSWNLFQIILILLRKKQNAIA